MFNIAKELRNLKNAMIAMGLSNGRASLVGVAFVGTTAVGNVGGGTDNLISYSLPANAMNLAKRGVRITAWGSTANNINAKTLILNFGSQAIHTSTLTASIAGKWWMEALVFSTGTDTQDWSSFLGTNGAAGVALNEIEMGTATQDDGAAIVIKCTGAATADNDIVQEGMLVEFL